MKYYNVNNLNEDRDRIYKSIKKLEELTGRNKEIFLEMNDGDVFFIDNFRIKCIEIYDEDEFTYYKNLWKF